MRKLKVYLSGATKNVSTDFQSWRQMCLDCEKHGMFSVLSFIDPLQYFNYEKKQPLTDKQCMNFFMWQIEQSDVLLVNLDDSKMSVGTLGEVEHAYCHNKPIIGFGSHPDTWYNWTKERCDIVLNNLDDALNYLDDFYGKVVC